MKTRLSVSRRQFLSGLFSITAAGIFSHQNNAIVLNQPIDHSSRADSINKVMQKQHMRPDDILPAEQTYVPKDHMEGFEKEESFNSILCDDKLAKINEQYGLRLNAAQVTRILEIINPEYFSDLFKRRHCVRKLKCIDTGQYTSNGKVISEDIDFRFGEIYESVAFNGGTYTVKRNDSFVIIGCSYFERVD